jgi:hypothetical protein
MTHVCANKRWPVPTQLFCTKEAALGSGFASKIKLPQKNESALKCFDREALTRRVHLQVTGIDGSLRLRELFARPQI